MRYSPRAIIIRFWVVVALFFCPKCSKSLHSREHSRGRGGEKRRSRPDLRRLLRGSGICKSSSLRTPLPCTVVAFCRPAFLTFSVALLLPAWTTTACMLFLSLANERAFGPLKLASKSARTLWMFPCAGVKFLRG